MHYFLIEFRYEYYCEGYEYTRGTLLVESDTFENACEVIRADGEYMNACNFINRTMLWRAK